VYYLSTGDVGITKFPKCFRKVQYPLLNLLETHSIGADSEGASISWIRLELRRSELVVEVLRGIVKGRTSISRTRKSTVGRLVAVADETCNPWSSKAPRVPVPPFTS
jgi:hypothetical protein